MSTSKTLSYTFSMMLCAVFAALLAAGAFIRIPAPFAPLTLQAEFAIMAGLLLGSKLGAVSTGLYLALGLLGLPVFALGGGLGYIFQPTFGYIIGFVAGSFLAGLVVENSKKDSNLSYFLACLAGLGAVYIIGLIYVLFIERFYLHAHIDMWVVIKYYLLLPLPGDLFLCAGIAVLTKRLKPAINKYPQLMKAVD